MQCCHEKKRKGIIKVDWSLVFRVAVVPQHQMNTTVCKTYLFDIAASRERLRSYSLEWAKIFPETVKTSLTRKAPEGEAPAGAGEPPSRRSIQVDQGCQQRFGINSVALFVSVPTHTSAGLAGIQSCSSWGK